MKRTTTEILIEVEETIAVRSQKQSVPAIENDFDRQDGTLIVCPFCEQTFAADKNAIQKNRSRKSKN